MKKIKLILSLMICCSVISFIGCANPSGSNNNDSGNVEKPVDKPEEKPETKPEEKPEESANEMPPRNPLAKIDEKDIEAIFGYNSWKFRDLIIDITKVGLNEIGIREENKSYEDISRCYYNVNDGLLSFNTYSPMGKDKIKNIYLYNIYAKNENEISCDVRINYGKYKTEILVKNEPKLPAKRENAKITEEEIESSLGKYVKWELDKYIIQIIDPVKNKIGISLKKDDNSVRDCKYKVENGALKFKLLANLDYQDKTDYVYLYNIDPISLNKIYCDYSLNKGNYETGTLTCMYKRNLTLKTEAEIEEGLGTSVWKNSQYKVQLLDTDRNTISVAMKNYGLFGTWETYKTTYTIKDGIIDIKYGNNPPVFPVDIGNIVLQSDGKSINCRLIQSAQNGNNTVLYKE